MSDGEEPDYGYCFVTGGKFKGKIVYYFDNETEKTAVVYPASFLRGYFRVPVRFLREATPEEAGEHLWNNEPLWPNNRKRILRDVFVEDFKMAQGPLFADEPHDNDDAEDDDAEDTPKRDIEADLKKQFGLVLTVDKAFRRKQLLRLMALAATWVSVMEMEAGQLPEEKKFLEEHAARKKKGVKT